MDRVIPFPGWTLPGVFTMGGSQVALKAQGCAIGEPGGLHGHRAAALSRCLSVCPCGRAGGGGAGYVPCRPGDTGASRPAVGRADLRQGHLVHDLAQGSQNTGARGYHAGRCRGRVGLEAVRYRDRRGHEHRIACTAWVSATASSPRCNLPSSPAARWRSIRSHSIGCRRSMRDGRALKGSVYLAGDGAGVAGADAAELRGRLAALALLADNGIATEQALQARLRAKLRRIMRFRNALERALPLPSTWHGRSPTRPSSAAARRSPPATSARAEPSRRRR